MGFSRGGTAALKAASSLSESSTKPDFVFALYPGDNSSCPNSHSSETSVSVFYGADDQWGSYQGNRKACQRMADKNSNTSFYLLENTHHGYDASWNGSWKCCGGRSFTNKHSAESLDYTRKIILQQLKTKWDI